MLEISLILLCVKAGSLDASYFSTTDISVGLPPFEKGR
jgi:hypothetical protein